MGDVSVKARSYRGAFGLVLAVGMLIPCVVSSAEAAAATTWHIVKSPNPTGGTASYLDGTSCTSASACTAVGYAGTAPATLIETWDGTAWHIVSSPNASGTIANYLSGVSCTGTACIAVGSSTLGGVHAGESVPLAEKWNGTAWSLVKAPHPTGALNSRLNYVSCASAAACIAVGETSTGGPILVEKWNGTAWTIVKSPPNPAGASSSQLTGVSCTSPTACIAVGNSSTSGGTVSTLAAKWNGTAWTVVKSPNQSGASDSYLNGVSCTATTACTAAGYSSIGGLSAGTFSTLVEKWNGTTWSVVKSPNRTGADSYLTGVSCTTATACSAVGHSETPSAISTLVETWNGSAWTLVKSPNPVGALISILSEVSCQSTFCSAAGYAFSSTKNVTLVEQN